MISDRRDTEDQLISDRRDPEDQVLSDRPDPEDQVLSDRGGRHYCSIPGIGKWPEAFIRLSCIAGDDFRCAHSLHSRHIPDNLHPRR